MVDELDFELAIQRVESLLEGIESVLERIGSRLEEQDVTLTKIVDRLELVIDEDRTEELIELMRRENRMSAIRAGIDLHDDDDEDE